MIRRIGVSSILFSTFFFPWTFTAVFALGLSVVEPLAPLAAGFLMDVLYYAPQGYALPRCTLIGGMVTMLVFFVRSRLKTGSI